MIKYFYPRTLKNITVAVIDYFNDIKIYKYDSSGTSAAEYTVPITFGPMTKTHLARIEDHEFIASGTDTSGYAQVESHGQRYWISVPRMALVMNGIAFDADRAYSLTEWREWFQETLAVSGANIDEILRDYQPTPYTLSFTLYIMTDSMDCFSQIMENILPYLQPSNFLRVKEFSFLNVERDLKITSVGVSTDFISPEMSDSDRREIKGTMDLTVEAWMYRPFEYSKLIKVIDSKYFVVDSSNTSATSALSADTSTTSDFDGLVVSADSFETSGALYTSAGTLESSAIPSSASYDFSGTYLDDKKDFAWFTSADTIT